MGKKAELIEMYKGEMKGKMGMKTIDNKMFENVVTACGPSIYNRDACKVAAGDKEEMKRIKKNFIAKKLGVTDEAKADKAIAGAVETMGKSNRNKYRAIFYYLVTKELKKSSVFK